MPVIILFLLTIFNYAFGKSLGLISNDKSGERIVLEYAQDHVLSYYHCPKNYDLKLGFESSSWRDHCDLRMFSQLFGAGITLRKVKDLYYLRPWEPLEISKYDMQFVFKILYSTEIQDGIIKTAYQDNEIEFPRPKELLYFLLMQEFLRPEDKIWSGSDMIKELTPNYWSDQRKRLIETTFKDYLSPLIQAFSKALEQPCQFPLPNGGDRQLMQQICEKLNIDLGVDDPWQLLHFHHVNSFDIATVFQNTTHEFVLTNPLPYQEGGVFKVCNRYNWRSLGGAMRESTFWEEASYQDIVNSGLLEATDSTLSALLSGLVLWAKNPDLTNPTRGIQQVKIVEKQRGANEIQSFPMTSSEAAKSHASVLCIHPLL